MKKYVVPVQAFAALGICAFLLWMTFLLAGINPNPPTAMDLQARSTKDMSFASMNSTAVALAKNMLANLAPSPDGVVILPVTGGGTPTSGPVALMTLKPIFADDTNPSILSLASPTSHAFEPTATRKKPSQPTAALVRASSTPAGPIATPVPPSQPATNTLLPATPVPTKTPKPTVTNLPTDTSEPPTAAPTRTPKATATDKPTNTPRPPNTPKPTDPPPTDPPPTQPPPTQPPPTDPPPTDPPPTDPPPTDPPPTPAAPLDNPLSGAISLWDQLVTGLLP
jgi:hypothetical protein